MRRGLRTGFYFQVDMGSFGWGESLSSGSQRGRRFEMSKNADRARNFPALSFIARCAEDFRHSVGQVTEHKGEKS